MGDSCNREKKLSEQRWPWSVLGSHDVSNSEYLSTFRRGILPKEPIFYKQKTGKINNILVVPSWGRG